MDLSYMIGVSRVCLANQIKSPLCIYSFLYLFNLGLTNLVILAILTTLGHIHISVLQKKKKYVYWCVKEQFFFATSILRYCTFAWLG